MAEHPRTRHVALVGPTASGKSAVALAAARSRSGVEIVTVDSMQVYRGMDIGTAKPTAAEQEEVPHHLLDLVDPADEFTVAAWQREARVVLAGIEARGATALLVGGTGLYLRSLTDDLEIPGRWPEVRADLEGELAEHGPERLHRRLHQLDPLAASRMEPSNARRVVRALEVTLGSGRRFSDFGPGLEANPPSSIAQVGLLVDPDELAERIAVRYERQLADGFVEEVAALADPERHPRGLSRTASQALGYKELLAHLDGTCSLAEAVDLAVRRTRQFARRQRAWFRRDARIRWAGPAEVADVLSDLLEESSG
jgi:tRNA dimethylallyltransferase